MEKFLLNIKPRDYQLEILEKCKEKNSLVILPTGVGKTLIALMLVIDRMQKFPTEKILFLAPTRPLAEQHLDYFKKHLPELFASIELFTGKVNASERKKIWQRADIIFSTPQCIANDLKKHLYNLSDVSLLIEDEAHRCVKNYSYTFVAKKFLEQSLNPRILGLTASPGTDKSQISQICKNLSIEAVEIRTRESEDVKKYLQELDFNVIKIEFPAKFEDIRRLLNSIFQKKVNELKERKLLFKPANKVTLLETQSRIMKALTSGNKSGNFFAGIVACSQAIKIQHALELLETQTLSSLNNYLQEIFKQARENKSKSVKALVTIHEFNKANILLQELLAEKKEHPKLLQLVDLIESKIKTNPNNKTIVFSQYRDSVSKISEELNKIKGINSRVFIGQAKKKTNQGLSQKDQKEVISKFSTGEFNVLCATSIGEEGLDIPEVNSVIFYEPVPSAIRKIQRAGRTARLMPGELIMLVTKNTRDEAYYYAANAKEKKMHKAIKEIKDDFNNGKINLSPESKQETLF